MDGPRAVTGTQELTTRIWLIRHGEPVEEARQRCYGSLDVGLSETGRRQMVGVAEYLAAESLVKENPAKQPLSAIYASPLSRTRESAGILAAALQSPLEISAGLREINFGDFEGLTYDEIAARHPDLYRLWMERPTQIRFPNGESFSEMRVRVLETFDEIRQNHAGQTIAMVSHGGVNRIVLAWALQMPDECLFRLAQDHAAVNLLEFIEGVPIVKMLNHSKAA